MQGRAFRRKREGKVAKSEQRMPFLNECRDSFMNEIKTNARDVQEEKL